MAKVLPDSYFIIQEVQDNLETLPDPIQDADGYEGVVDRFHARSKFNLYRNGVVVGSMGFRANQHLHTKLNGSKVYVTFYKCRLFLEATSSISHFKLSTVTGASSNASGAGSFVLPLNATCVPGTGSGSLSALNHTLLILPNTNPLYSTVRLVAANRS